MPKIIVGRSESDKEEHGIDGTGVIGKHLVGEDEEAHTANPLHFDLAKPHVIGVFGKRGTGKCLLPNEKIVTPEGLEKAGQIFQKGIENGEPEIQNDDEKLYKFKGQQVQSVGEDFNLGNNRIKAVYGKKVDEELIKIKTRSGRKLTVTKEHPLLTIGAWKEAGKINEGQRVGIPRKLDVNFSDEELDVPDDFESAEYANRNRRESNLLEQEETTVTEASDGTGSYRRVLDDAEEKDLITVEQGQVEVTQKGRQELESRKTGQHYRFKKSNPIKLPEKVNSELSKFMAYLIAEGHEQKVTQGNYRIMFTNNNEDLLESFRDLTKELFDLEVKEMGEDTLYTNSKALEEFLEHNGYSTGNTSFDKKIPDFIVSASEETVSIFLQKYFDCEANVTDQQLDLMTASEEVAESILYMLLRFGIVARHNVKSKYASNTEEQKVRDYHQLTVSGEDNLRKFKDKIGFSIQKKSSALKFAIKEGNTNVDTVPCGELIKECREEMGADRTQISKYKQSLKAYEDGKYAASRNKLSEITKNLSEHLNELRDLKKEVKDDEDLEKLGELVDNSGVKWKNLNKKMGCPSKSGRALLSYKKYQENPQEMIEKGIELFEQKHNLDQAEKNLKRLQNLSKSDVYWDEVENIKKIEYDGWVYDVTVENDHSFTAGFGGILCHNSYSMGTLVEELQTCDISENISTIMIDPMGIFWSMKRPNERDVSILDKWDLKPKAFDAQVYIPKGKTKDFNKKEMPFDDTFTLNPAQLTSEEWRMAFGIESNTEMSIFLERLVEDLTEEFEDKYRIKHMKEAIDTYEFPQKTKRGLENRFNNAQDWGIFGETSSIDKLTSAGELSVVDVSVFGQLSGGTRVQALVVSILAKRILRRRMAARRLEELDEMQGLDRADEPIQWMLIDEAHEYLPAKGETPATDPLLRWVKIGREPGVSLVLCTQQPAKLHPNALSQMDLLLAHRLTAQQDIDALQKIMQTYMRYDLRHYIDALPDRPGTAMIMDDNSERAYPAQMRPRKSWHAGGTPDAFE